MIYADKKFEWTKSKLEHKLIHIKEKVNIKNMLDELSKSFLIISQLNIYENLLF